MAVGVTGHRRLAGLMGGETQAAGNLVENVHVAVGAAESVLAGTPGVDGDVSQGVDADGLVGGEGAVDDEAVGGVVGGDVVLVANLLGGHAGALLVDDVVLADVGVGANAGGNGVARLPVGGEVGAGAVLETGGLVVLGQTRLLIGANGAALATLVLLVGQVLGVGRTVDAERSVCL